MFDRSMGPWESVPATPEGAGAGAGMAAGGEPGGGVRRRHPRLRAAIDGIQTEAASPGSARSDTLTDFRDTRPIVGPRCVIRCEASPATALDRCIRQRTAIAAPARADTEPK
jgi:hypothetical protein